MLCLNVAQRQHAEEQKCIKNVAVDAGLQANLSLRGGV